MITLLSPTFGSKVRGSGDSVYKYTMLHWAAKMGHCDVACYLIEVLNLNPQDRDKVCVRIFLSVCVCVCQCVSVVMSHYYSEMLSLTALCSTFCHGQLVTVQ